MRHYILGIVTGILLASVVGTAYAVVQNALTDANGVHSMLGDYGGAATRVQCDSSGYIYVEGQ